MSAKLKKDTVKYLKVKNEFLNKPENKRCRVNPKKAAVDVHHMKGRKGYADQESKERGIKLLWDVRFFLPVSRTAHTQIEDNPEWAKDKGYSLTRTDIVF